MTEANPTTADLRVMTPLIRLARLALPLVLASAPAAAEDVPQGCVTRTLNLLVYLDDDRSSAKALNQNIVPPSPPGNYSGMPAREPEPAPAPPPPPPPPEDCPTLHLPAFDPRAQTLCEMADDLPGARCLRQWSGRTLVVEPFD